MACEDDYCTIVVFAESAGKAKSYVLKYIFDGVNYCDLIANRVPLIDKYYQKNKKYMDWMNPNDRLILVKELGLRCAFYTSDIPYCQNCRAKNYCKERLINEQRNYTAKSNIG